MFILFIPVSIFLFNLIKIRTIKTKNIIDRQNPIEKNRFIVNKIKDVDEWDVIIIGSGISSLTCACLLSKVGKKVLVLEQHYIAGGCTHSFMDKGFEFDTGVHYVGNKNGFDEILNLVTEKNNRIEWDQLGKDNYGIYDEIFYDKNKSFKLRAGKNEFKNDLISMFPDDEDAINKYFNDMKKYHSMINFFIFKLMNLSILNYCLNKLFSYKFFNCVNTTVDEYMNNLTSNINLRAILCGQFGDLGLPPKKNSLFMHFGLVNHYLNGAWYPRGGSSNIAKKIIPVIEKYNGKVLVNCRVNKIVVGDRVEGVLTDKNIFIKSKKVVSSAGLLNTYNRLLDETVIKKFNLQKQYDKVNKLKGSMSFIYLFVGLNDMDDIKLPSHNIWSWNNPMYDDLMDKWFSDPESFKDEDIPGFISFPFNKDSEWKDKYGSKGTAIVIVPFPYSSVEQWNNNKNYEYNEFKEKYKQRLINKLISYNEKIKDKIIYTNLATPLTFNTFINSLYGESYGLNNGKERYELNDWNKPKSKIPGLYLTGQDTLSIGFSGSLTSGMLTFIAIEGFIKTFALIKKGGD